MKKRVIPLLLLLVFILVTMAARKLFSVEIFTNIFVVAGLISPFGLLYLFFSKSNLLGFNLQKEEGRKVDILVCLFLLDVIVLFPSYKIGFVNLEHYWYLAFFVGLFFFLITFRYLFQHFSPFSKWAHSFGCLLLGFVYAYGLIVVGNCYFKSEIVERVEVEVTMKPYVHDYSFDYDPIIYDVYVSDRGNFENKKFYLFKEEYDQLAKYQRVYIVVKKGMLGLNWHELSLN